MFKCTICLVELLFTRLRQKGDKNKRKWYYGVICAICDDIETRKCFGMFADIAKVNKRSLLKLVQSGKGNKKCGSR